MVHHLGLSTKQIAATPAPNKMPALTPMVRMIHGSITIVITATRRYNDDGHGNRKGHHLMSDVPQHITELLVM